MGDSFLNSYEYINNINNIISKKKYIHVMTNDKFCIPFVQFINRNYDGNEHFFLIQRKHNYFPFPKATNAIEIDELNGVMFENDIIKKVIFHSLFMKKVFFYLNNNMEIQSKKCYWMIFGGDLYDAPNDDTAIRVRKNFKGYISDTDGDCDVAKEKYDLTNKEYYNAAYTFPITLEMIENELNKQVDKKFIRIQVNNSCDVSTIRIINELSRFEKYNCVIRTVLSYGKLQYKNDIIKLGNSIFGDRFEYLDKMIAPSEYVSWIAKNDIFILAQNRQQGIGNAFASLELGTKLFVKSDVTTFNHLMTKGIYVFDTNSISEMQYDEFIMYDSLIKKQNMERAKIFFDDSYLKKCWDPILK